MTTLLHLTFGGSRMFASETGGMAGWHAVTMEVSGAGEGEFGDVLDLIPVLVRDMDGTILFCTTAACKLYGWRHNEMVGQRVQSLLLAEADADQMERILERLVTDGEWKGELIHRRRDGSTIWVASHWILRRDRDGAPHRVIEINRNISEWKCAVEALRQSEEQFRALADSIPQLAWIADDTGSVFWHNRRWYEYTGATFEETEGWGWQMAQHPDHVRRVVDRIRLNFATGEDWEDTFPIRGADGQYRWFLSRATPIRNSEGRVVKWFGTSTDVTEQKQSEDALRRSNEDLQRFAYVASHDLQEPLRMIAAYTQLLIRKSERKSDRESAMYVRNILNGVSRMTALIHDLLEYSRITHETTRGKTHTDMNAILGLALEHLQFKISEAEAKVTFDSLPVLPAHDGRLLQVFQNLIANGVKYNEGKPLIHVSAERAGSDWKFSVRDNGIGIDPRYQDQIFRVFQRLHGRDQYTGTGVGLAICKRIIEQHGGRIWVESQPGAGSTFFFTLPAE